MSENGNIHEPDNRSFGFNGSFRRMGTIFRFRQCLIFFQDSYSVEGSSLLRTKITPLPPNTFMQRILDMKAQMLQQEFALTMKKAEVQLELERRKLEEEMKKETEKLNPATPEPTPSPSPTPDE